MRKDQFRRGDFSAALLEQLRGQTESFCMRQGCCQQNQVRSVDHRVIQDLSTPLGQDVVQWTQPSHRRVQRQLEMAFHQPCRSCEQRTSNSRLQCTQHHAAAERLGTLVLPVLSLFQSNLHSLQHDQDASHGLFADWTSTHGKFEASGHRSFHCIIPYFKCRRIFFAEIVVGCGVKSSISYHAANLLHNTDCFSCAVVGAVVFKRIAIHFAMVGIRIAVVIIFGCSGPILCFRHDRHAFIF
mmetsp:Transcript_24939/g.69991  ORF Transcript_24939/g.69991 Transcript_24939/m.69991 type:complete len:241 (-) Transcript_24939:385-1107(-)